MDPSVIKKIQEKRQERVDPDAGRIPAIQDLPISEKPRNLPERTDDLKREAPTSIEIQVA